MSNPLAVENRQLREQLNAFLEQARCNEEIMRRHHSFDLAFVGASGFRELVESIFQTLAQASGLDVITLSLMDTDYQIRRILVELQVDLAALPNLLFLQDESEFGELHDRLRNPVLGRYSEQHHGRLFPEPVPLPASVAIVPLRRNHRLIGSLNLGSFHETRFMPNMATDFVEHLASIVAICVENVINQERLKHIGLTDPLTGVNNRRYVERRLLEEIGRALRQPHALSCMYIDIDHFKQINDRVGHHGGDQVLREVAARIKAELRLSDALGRFGGEEFVALLIDVEQADALCVAERIRAAVADQPLGLESGDAVSVTVSIGVGCLVAPERAETAEVIAQKFIARADQALYKAKESGRNRVVGADH